MSMGERSLSAFLPALATMANSLQASQSLAILCRVILAGRSLLHAKKVSRRLSQFLTVHLALLPKNWQSSALRRKMKPR